MRRIDTLKNLFRAYGMSALAVLAAAAFSALIVTVLPQLHVSTISIVPVFASAIWWGLGPALFAAVMSVWMGTLVYHPHFSMRAADSADLLDLVIFSIVAIVISRLAAQLSRQMRHAMSQEAEVRRLDALSRDNELRDILLNSVAHELRTPLSSVLGAATALADAPCVAADAKLSSLARLIAEDGHRLNAVIQDALDATRVRSGALVPRLEWVEISDVLNAALDRLAQRLGRHRVDIRFLSHPPLLRLDAPLVEQALINVLENAAKYAPEQMQISIAISHAGDRVTLHIADEGPGLSEVDAARMFDRGYRGERHNDAVAGTGMGLAIAKTFIEANGGTISAQSRGADRGTLVEISLPVPAMKLIEMPDD